jgi:ubiquitin-conjugating enzyme E2 A
MRERLIEEYRMVQQDSQAGLLSFTAGPRDGNLRLWDAVIYGPENSDWSGATLKAEIHFPENYPKESLRIYIKTEKMFHPNVRPSDGYFCSEMFDSPNWKPDYNVIAAVATIQAILVCPNPDSAYRGEAAGLWRENRTEYWRRVRETVEQSWKDF